MHPLDFATEQSTRQSLVLFLRGEVDGANAAELRDILTTTSRNYASVVIDMADTTFVDGAVLSAIASSLQSFPDGVRVRRPSAFVSKVFRLAGLDGLLTAE